MILNTLHCAIIAIITSIVAFIFNPRLVLVAYKKNLLDRPNHRKLQVRPIPVIGGMSVYMSLIIGLVICNFWFSTDKLFITLAGISLMFYTGLFDDWIDIRAYYKLLLQIGVVVMLWWVGDFRIDTFNGLFGIYSLPLWFSLLFSVFAGVGLINAINLIDGVDGLSSSIGMLSSGVAGLWFIIHDDPMFASLCFCFVGALFPFYIFNNFSRKFKMYIGDSGTLMMGTIAYIITTRALQECNMHSFDVYCVTLMLTLYALPVFDTLRVMTMRILDKKSPFNPDKTHLHHILVSLGFPHILVAFIELFIQIILLVIWLTTSMSNINPDIQFILIIVCASILDVGTYMVLNHIQKTHPANFRVYSLFVRESTKPIYSNLERTRERVDRFFTRKSKKYRHRKH